MNLPITLAMMVMALVGVLAGFILYRKVAGEQIAVVREWLRREASLSRQYRELFENALEVDSQSAEHAMLQFSVRDTGIGIPPEKQKLIFGPFDTKVQSKRYLNAILFI